MIIHREKKKILYLNKQYRDYDYLKYITLIKEFDLIMIWICPFRDSDPVPPEIIDHIRFQVLGFKGNKIKPWHVATNIRLFKMILKYIKNIDLVMSSTSDAWHSKIAFLAARISNKPIALRKEVWKKCGGFFNNINHLLTTFIEKHSRAVFHLGAKQKEFLVSYNFDPEKLFVFPYLIDDLREEELNQDLINELSLKCEGKFVFLYLGRVIPRKGLDILIKVFLRLEELHHDIFLLVVGGPAKGLYSSADSYNYYEYCRSLAETSENILVAGYSNPSLKQNYFHIAHAFVHPHKKNVDNKEVWEGWGNVVVEAASMGLPLITTDRVASAYELVNEGKNGFIVSSEEDIEGGLYSALKFILENRGEMGAFGDESRRLYEIYNDPARIIKSVQRALNNG